MILNKLKRIGIAFILPFMLVFSGCGGGGDASFDNQSSSASGFTISGNLVKGKVLNGYVVAYTADGTEIGRDTTIVDGKYEIYSSGYEGLVEIKAYITSYVDEASEQNISVKVLNLNAFSYVNKDSSVVNITPVTEVSYMLLGGEDLELSNLNSNDVSNMNRNTAYSLGAGNIDPTKSSITVINKGENNITNSPDIQYGMILAAVSADSNITSSNDGIGNERKVSGSIDKLLDSLKKGDSSAISTIVSNGLANANISLVDTNRSIVPVSTTSVGSFTHSFSDVINANRSQNSVSSGTATITAVTGSVYLNIDNGYVSIDGGVTYAKSLLLPTGNSTVHVKYTAPNTLSTTNEIILYAKDKNVSFNVTTKDANLSTISSYVDTNGVTPSTLTVDDFINAGVQEGSVTTDNIQSINDFIKDVNDSDANSTQKLQSIIDVLAYIDNNASVDKISIPNAEDYTNFGITGVDSGNINLLNASISNKGDDEISKAGIQDIATTLASLQNITNGSTTLPSATPTTSQLTDLGLTGLTDSNRGNLLVVMKNYADNNGGNLPSLEDLQDLVDTINNTVSILKSAATSNTATGNVTSSDYNATGVENTVDGNLATYNDYLDSDDVSGGDVNTTTKLQGFIDGVNALVSGTPDMNLTTLSALGLDDDVNASDVNETVMFNSIIPPADGNVTVENIENIALANKNIRDIIEGITLLPVGNPADYVNYLATLGVNPTVNSDSVAGYLQLLQRDGNATTLVDLNSSSQGQIDAINHLQIRANENNASLAPALSQTDYMAVGLSAAESSNVISYNDFLDSEDVNSTIIETYDEIKEFVSAVNDLESNATLTQNELSLLGLGNGNDMNISNNYHVTLINDVLQNDSNKTAAHLEELADAVKLIQDVADSTTGLPLSGQDRIDMLAALSLLGIVNVVDSNLDGFLSNLQDGGATGSDTVVKIQSNESLPVLPSTITIDDGNLSLNIVSIFDNDYGVDIQGQIDVEKNISVPYTVTGSATTLLAYTSESKTIATGYTEDGVSGITLTFSWDEQANLPVGNGTFTAKVTASQTYNAKKLDVDDNTSGVVIANFDYETDDNSNNTLGNLRVKILVVIPDKMFGLADNSGDTTSHMFLYQPVVTETGKTWLNNNLGANYANVNHAQFDSTQQATGSGDYHAYGSLFQWGRKPDGHELINWTASDAGSGVYDTNPTNSDNPSHSDFITESRSPYDWRINPDDTLWANEDSVNNPCPSGYRLPTGGSSSEWADEVNKWSSSNSVGAMSSVLKVPLPGFRNRNTGVVYNSNSNGFCWSCAVSGDNAHNLHLNSSAASPGTSSYRANGFSVRCLKN
jgi:hypothetical protein